MAPGVLISKIPARWKRPERVPMHTSIGDWRVIPRALRYVKDYGVVIQAGSHIGVWPAILSEYFKQVVSFEPVPALAAVAREAAPYDNVQIFEFVLSETSGILKLQVPGEEKMARFSGSSTLAAEGTEVQAITVDSIAPELKCGLGAIFLDIEGHELPALKGAVETIRQWHPVIVVEENAKSLRHRPPGAVAAFLKPFGYRKVGNYFDDLIFAVR